jgi:hypothetical protein
MKVLPKLHMKNQMKKCKNPKEKEKKKEEDSADKKERK